uniref:Mitochondrial import inner membrane translocase subunit n=1 Tax=Neobodo designis TaxID=312471 RepID=A0A7S1QII7_NEODS|eukprot:CAMPEP_0174848564 /NCGR_PEP_ID=MMETSP1114-20130205/13598_1 /TAXON_ID=312471 /ORGANISM="Neobodo designis, Strain CCAP 1951/1" /LENGTH=107 /DNA_ID=CAMNT_0016082867 /DNA_START=38 /DNA_END=361 /DNA_ORIENTATION=-
MNQNFPGLPPAGLIVTSEKVQSATELGFPYCWSRCVTHFGEDSLPYHPGEKTCFDRCMNKLWSGYEIAKDARKATEKVAKESEGMQWKWMQDLDEFYKVTPPEVPRF